MKNEINIQAIEEANQDATEYVDREVSIFGVEEHNSILKVLKLQTKRDMSKAIALIGKFEGLFLRAYLDPVGIWTIGYGTIRYPNGMRVRKGDKITKKQAEEYLLEHIESMVFPALKRYIDVPLNDNQYQALVSFIYNVGSGNFKTSTLRKKINRKDFDGAANEFKKWNKGRVNGRLKVLKGLTRRRKAERVLFETQVSSIIDVPVPEDDIEDNQSPVETPDKLSFWEIVLNFFKKLFGFGEVNKDPDDIILDQIDDPIYSKGNGPRITRQEVEKILKTEGADTSKVCLLGIRGYYLDSMGKPGKNDRGIFDDALIWFYPDSFMTFKANTDPTRYRAGRGFGSKKGMANLKAGHWTYKMGIHRGSYIHPAFRQADKVTVIRDGFGSGGSGDYDNTGWFGINIHRAGRGTSSLGCQTVPKSSWNTFKSLGYDKLKYYNQKTFSYVLIEEEKRQITDKKR